MSLAFHNVTSRLKVRLPATSLAVTLLLATVGMSTFAGCEVDMQVSVDGKVPPTFTMQGSGYLVFFIVSEISPENQKLAPGQRDSSKDRVIWNIRPTETSYENLRIRNLPSIKYGEVPPGFTQKEPAQGNPPALVEGKVYEAGGPNTGANGGFVWFVIRNGKSEEIEQPDGY